MHKMPRDFKFGQAAQFATAFRAFSYTAICPELHQIYRFFTQNVERSISLAALPVECAYWSGTLTKFSCQAKLEILHTLTLKQKTRQMKKSNCS